MASLNYVEEGDVSNVLAAPQLRAVAAAATVWPMAFGSTSELVQVQQEMMVIFMHNCYDKYVMQTFSEIYG